MKDKYCSICLEGEDVYRMADKCTQATFELHLKCPLCHPENKDKSIEKLQERR